MMPRSRSFLLLAFALAGCGDDGGWNVGEGSSTPAYRRVEEDPSLLGNTIVPVRVGELGEDFAACNAQGLVREVAADGPIAVRAAPFDQARQTGQLPTGLSFYICTRSLDQRWLGIVYDPLANAGPRCGVAAPAARRRDYEGPCESGWVASAQVRLTSGLAPPPAEASQNGAQPN